MNKETLAAMQYPIGRFTTPKIISDTDIMEWIIELEALPEDLASLVAPLSDTQLNTPYRPEGWTIRQVIHHLADSHFNSYIRFKWALTEDLPTIKPYDEKQWSILFDARTAPISLSLNGLSAVHAKMVFLLKGLSPSDLERTYIHPDGETVYSIKETIGRYAWHGKHHYTHIKNALVREGWL
ncbi:putative metal-dependent hydrolase [Arenibacter sp. GZD96]|uniref:YfiT family bacillithiol transferase n=1 Tax=Aurantibrevibacter litoralis TaxID=3106030 RepID=UPI002AFF08EA|nr:putative metal-dependent hydrolase [Arenibacter sp. GZD-96]MEA1787060.1 putative metal-dependent hydrolase [Arenibacter sp. GZD-96]